MGISTVRYVPKKPAGPYESGMFDLWVICPVSCLCYPGLDVLSFQKLETAPPSWFDTTNDVEDNSVVTSLSQLTLESSSVNGVIDKQTETRRVNPTEAGYNLHLPLMITISTYLILPIILGLVVHRSIMESFNPVHHLSHQPIQLRGIIQWKKT